MEDTTNSPSMNFQIFRPGKETSVRGEGVLPPNPTHDEIENLVAPIVGGRMLHLTVLYNGAPASMFVYEFRDRENFERNDAATTIFRQASVVAQPDIDIESLPVIKGSAVIFDHVVLAPTNPLPPRIGTGQTTLAETI